MQKNQEKIIDNIWNKLIKIMEYLKIILKRLFVIKISIRKKDDNKIIIYIFIQRLLFYIYIYLCKGKDHKILKLFLIALMQIKMGRYNLIRQELQQKNLDNLWIKNNVSKLLRTWILTVMVKYHSNNSNIGGIKAKKERWLSQFI